jgi:hypothetical protein
LATAVDSILGQSFRDFELILADNASTDATESICRRYAAADSRVRYCRAETNGGLAWNFNRVVELARGEYFKWGACDDLCEPTFLARAVETLDAHPEAAWCHPWTSFIDPAGEPDDGPTGPVFRYTDQPGPGTFSGPGRDALNVADRFRAVVLGPGECYDMFGLMRLSALRQTALQRTFFGGDKVLIAELALRGRFLEIPEPLFVCRNHPTQTTLSPARQRERTIRGSDPGPLILPRRVSCFLGYLGLIATGRLSVVDRVRCLLTLARLCCNGWRWRRWAWEALPGASWITSRSAKQRPPRATKCIRREIA